MVERDEEHYYEIWRYDGASNLFDESAITSGYLPSTAGLWTDVTSSVTGDITIDCSYAARGYKVTFTVLYENRALWDEGKPLAIVHQHWTGTSGLGARALLLWGFLGPEGIQRALGASPDALRVLRATRPAR
jgi:hypothetical protein